VLVVKPGNAVVLERGGTTTRILGPGVHTLQRFEVIKRPHQGKGIIDLRPQQGNATVRTLTKDGIPIDIHVSQSWQIEPKSVTESHRASQLAGGAATTPVLGAPEYPVYEATVRKAVFATPAAGWASAVAERGLETLRDIVATYTLDEIFPVNPKTSGHGLIVRQIEQDVIENYDPAVLGAAYLAIDIRQIDVPDDIREQLVRRWKAPLERQVRLVQARAEREALVELSEGRAQALDKLEGAKLSARANMARMVTKIIDDMVQQHQGPVAVGFVDLVRELSERIGQDEQVALRYIEAVQAVIEGEGVKSFVFNPPYSGPAAVPPPSPPSSAGEGGGAAAQAAEDEEKPLASL
jgi:regulator of protease activity HflC (stomatin/prohibitin superfamily)